MITIAGFRLPPPSKRAVYEYKEEELCTFITHHLETSNFKISLVPTIFLVRGFTVLSVNILQLHVHFQIPLSEFAPQSPQGGE